MDKWFPGSPLSNKFRVIGGGSLFRIPVPAMLFVAIGIISYLILSKSKFGKHIYAVGGNEQASVVCGIRSERVKIKFIHMQVYYLV